MATSVHQLDDGAWVSVDDSRAVSVSELWRVRGFCGCEQADFLTEAFVAVGVSRGVVEARVAGMCIDCGTEGVTDWLALGRVVEGTFRPLATGSVRQPRSLGQRAVSEQHLPERTSRGQG